MMFSVALVNPKTNEQRTITVSLSPEQIAAAKSSPCEQTYVQGVARPDIPDGFMPLGNGVRRVTLQ